MKNIKRLALRIFIGVEVLVFAGFYIFGGQGVKTLMRMQADIHGINQDIDVLRQEIGSLEEQVGLYDATTETARHSFYKMQEARKLQMAFPDEEVYITNE